MADGHAASRHRPAAHASLVRLPPNRRALLGECAGDGRRGRGRYLQTVCTAAESARSLRRSDCKEGSRATVLAVVLDVESAASLGRRAAEVSTAAGGTASAHAAVTKARVRLADESCPMMAITLWRDKVRRARPVRRAPSKSPVSRAATLLWAARARVIPH